MYAVLRCAPLVVRVVVGERARLRLLVEDYAARARGADHGAWLERMLASGRPQKRLGGERVAALQAQLVAGEYEGVAKVLIAYYDKLYDAHVANGSGSGSGVGARPGVVLDAVHPPELPELDAPLLARQVLRAVAQFEARESESGGEAEGRTEMGTVRYGTSSRVTRSTGRTESRSWRRRSHRAPRCRS